jgi:hypothetical protein
MRQNRSTLLSLPLLLGFSVQGWAHAEEPGEIEGSVRQVDVSNAEAGNLYGDAPKRPAVAGQSS